MNGKPGFVVALHPSSQTPVVVRVLSGEQQEILVLSPEDGGAQK